MSAEHTPGPWMTWVDRNGVHEVGPSTNCTVALLLHPTLGSAAANARLIAAAPELLRACQTFEAWLRREEAGLPGGVVRDTPEGEAQWREWYDENLRLCAEAQTQARAAIEKATRETP